MTLNSKISLLCVCLGLALTFSLYRLTESPQVWYDEGIYTQIAINSAVFGTNNIQVAPDHFVTGAFVTGGYPFIQPISWAFRLFGIGVLQSRLVMVMFIMLLVALLFTLVYRMFGYKQAILAAFLCMTFPVLYGNGKTVLGEVPGLVYLFAFLWSVYELERRKYSGISLYIYAGIAAGLCVATKPIFLLLGGAVVAAVFVHRKTVEWNFKGLRCGLVAFIIPVAVWLLFQFQHGDTASSVAQYYANPYGISDLGSQILTNFIRFFTESSPIYLLLFTIVWVASYSIRLRDKVSISLTEKIALFTFVLVIAAYLRTAGWYRYFFIAQILSIAFLPHALTILCQKIKNQKYVTRCAVAICLVFIAFQSYQLLFTSWVAQHYTSTTSAQLTAYFTSVWPQSTFFIYDAPEVVEFLPNRFYYQYVAPTEKLVFGKDQLSAIEKGIPDVIVARRLKWESEVAPLAKKYTVIGVIGGVTIAHRNDRL